MKSSIVVIGLGQFGIAAALELMALGHEVLAIDIDEARVNAIASEVTHAIVLDASDDQALASAGAGDFEHAIVAIGTATEASIFATMTLKRLGVTNVLAKATSALHGSILERVGADRVVYAEQEMGERSAHSLGASNVVDYLDVAPGFGLVRLSAPASWVGRTVADIVAGGGQEVSLVALRRGTEVTVNPGEETVVAESDEFFLIGPDERLFEASR